MKTVVVKILQDSVVTQANDKWANYIHPPLAKFSTVYMCNDCAENYENRLTVDKVIAKISRLTLPPPLRV